MRFFGLVAAFGGLQLISKVLAVADTDSLMDGDSSQSGYLPNHNMDPAVISGGSFGQIWNYVTPTGASEQFYAKPLVLTPSSTGRQIVLCFSEQNRIYSLDAVNGTLIATRDLGQEGEIPFLVSDLGSCNDISGTIGVTGTPIIDPATDTVYFWAKSYIGKATGYQNGAYRFHGIDAVTLQERPGFPTAIQGVGADNDAARRFTGGTVLQRPSLNLVNGVIFAGFGGHCDQYNYTGWIVGMQANTGKLLTAYATSGGPGSPAQDGTWTGGGGGCAVWMAGAGISSDQSGRIFYATGNGYKSPVNGGQPASGRVHLSTLSEAVVNMAVNPSTGAITQQDYFEPYNYQAMDAADRDLGSGGVSLPDPSVFSGTGVSRLAITAGKNGIGYILNADNLGGYKLGSGGSDAIIQTFSMPGGGSVFGSPGTYPLEGGYLYITPVGYATQVYSLGHTSSGIPAFTLVAQTPDVSAGRVGVGPATVTTYKGQAGTGILWIIDPDAGLRAYNAVPVNGNMTKIVLPASPGVSKYQRPAFGDGRYYISTSNGHILAYGSPIALALACTSPIDFGLVPIGNTKTINITCTTNIAIVKFTGFKTSSTLYTVSNSSLPSGSLIAGTSFKFPITFDLTNHQLNSGSTSSSEAVPGVQTSSISIMTVNGKPGYATTQPISVTGKSISPAPFITMNPLQVDFSSIVVGSALAVTGSDATFIINNVGMNKMTILGIAFTNGAINSGNTTFYNLTTATRNGNTVVQFDKYGDFTSGNMPAVGTVVEGGASITVEANFNTNATGTYYTLLQVYTDGGNAYTIFSGTAASSPIALLEYSTNEGGWVTIPDCNPPDDGCTSPVAFAPSPGLTSQTIQLRLSNKGGSALTITKSKPLEGAELSATNPDTDFSEGLAIVPGGYALASILFSPAAAALNSDSKYYSGVWTLNTDDLTFGVHSINFTGSVVPKKVGPVDPSGNSIFKYLGCYQDFINNVRLENKEYNNVNNTNGQCQTEAQAYGAVFAGTEYYTECWVGSVIPSQSLLEPDSSCNYQCAGDPTQSCGGVGGMMSLFYDSTKYFPANGTIAGGGGSGPIIPKTIGAYSYAGCYSDSTAARSLSGKAAAGSAMTLESCADTCNTYNFFGTEYSDECYCGNIVSSASILHADTDCNMQCAGNTTEFCGGSSRLSLYKRSGAAISNSASPSSATSKSVGSASLPGSSTTASAGPSKTSSPAFKSLGCYTDNTVTSRTLVGKATADPGLMTIEYCAIYCTAFTYFGLEYGDECYCGNVIAQTGIPATDKRCSMKCVANSAEICGGSYGLNIYIAVTNGTISSSSTTLSTLSSLPLASSTGISVTTAQSSSATSSTSNSVPATPTVSIPPVIGAFTYQHCHSDNVTTRTLRGKYVASTGMTLQYCAGNCTGYAYFGVEYAAECYCANSLSYGSFVATDSRCNMKCSGNPLEYCGGSNGLTLYENSTLSASSSSSSLISSATSTIPSALISLSNSSSSSTSASTSSSSLTKSTIRSSTSRLSTSSPFTSTRSVPSTLSTSSGSAQTSFNPSVPGSPSSSSTSSSSSRTLTSTSMVSTPSIDPNWSYLGCANDTVTARALVGAAVASTMSMTIEYCQSYCLSQSFPLAGVEYASQCYCALALGHNSTIGYTGCSMPCAGSKIQFCGGSSRLSVYNYTAFIPPVIPPKVALYTYSGCYQELTNARAITNYMFTNTTSMTVDMCVNTCQVKGYPIAGVEYGSQCFCGNSLNTGAVRLDDSQCEVMTCPGNLKEYCATGSRLQVYST